MTIEKKLDTIEGISQLLELADFSPVYREADRVRRENVGDIVHLRAIIEFSNVCKRRCIYCGLNSRNEKLQRFRMNKGEILDVAGEAVAAGYRTIVLQSGEDDFFSKELLGEIIENIKAMELPGRTGEHPFITVSCGEKDEDYYRYIRDAGADRYLLKHETADAKIYDSLHPCGTLAERVNCLKTLKALGFETGSGFMVGLPGQTTEVLAKDLLLLKNIPCDMAGIGPFISNPNTELAGLPNGEPELTRRAVAIARLLLPKANLPVTTSLAVLTEGENPFNFGANVIMKKVTPDEYKAMYEIYPADFAPTNIEEDRRILEQKIIGYERRPV